ncbi:hypothetical protein, partial [Persephonella sp.]
MYLGPFYFDTKELFLVFASAILALALFFNWPICWFDKAELLTVTVLVLITKGLLPAIHNEAFLFLVLATIFLTLYLPIFQVILFYFLAFVFFRV